MDGTPALLAAAVVGYLLGSISSARLVGVSATAVAAHLGGRWAILVSVLDVAKAALPAFAFARIAPGTDAALVAAAAAVVGHVWPVWHRFAGGFGVTTILGGLLAVEPLAIPVTIVVGGIIGVALADRLVGFDGWTLLLPVWFVVRDDPAGAVYAAVVVAVYWWAMRDEVLDHVRRLRRGGRPWRERLGDFRSGYTGRTSRPTAAS
ncbi:MAG: glycerol-3-phosphate acyltransferase [Actinomycetota bacterium]